MADRPERKAEGARSVVTLGEASAHHNRLHMLPAALPKLINLDQRIADMDEMGVDIQVVSPAPSQYYYWADRALTSLLVETQNQGIASLCRSAPGRLLGLGNLSMQYPDLAIDQMTHAVRDLGLKGFEISSTVNGLEVADHFFEPFWATAAALGCVVFIHPLGTSAHERLNRFYLTNVIGQPLETTIALSHLIFSGVLDRHPGLKLVAAHGGGYLPAYFGRAQHAFNVRPEAAQMRMAPRDYLKRIWFDTVVYEPEMLAHLIGVVGISQVVVGTDYPYDMGDYQVHRLVGSMDHLTVAERSRILGGNAAELLGIAKTQPAGH